MKRIIVFFMIMVGCGVDEDVAIQSESESIVMSSTDLYVECGYNCDRRFYARCGTLGTYDELDRCWDDCRAEAPSYPVDHRLALYNLYVCERLRNQQYTCTTGGGWPPAPQSWPTVEPQAD